MKQELSITSFSELTAIDVISIKIIRKEEDLQELGYGKYESVVIIKTRQR